ncbi:MAG: hypothetical protein CL774_00430 [Chloroflexi bacterium]|nr:hypothetical protein [Chloroflexota bacterium]|tara:strand:- start:3710 stop:4027 length:318 start_codon:yes stop_codon:yes gene_type:complete
MIILLTEYFNKYFDFQTRTNRRDYWVTFLLIFLLGILFGIINAYYSPETGLIQNVWSLVTIIPSLALGSRRLHDTNRSGFWQLLWLIPIFGWVVIIYFLSRPSVD